MKRQAYTVRAEGYPDTTFYADSYEDAAIKFDHDGEMTVEGDEYFVTFIVDTGCVSEIDREEKNPAPGAQSFKYVDGAGEAKPIVADTLVDAVKLAAQLLGPSDRDMVIDMETDTETVTFIYKPNGEIEEADRQPLERLAEVRLVVRVPVNVDLEEYLNEVSFDCMIDGKDIYERTEGYTSLEETA